MNDSLNPKKKCETIKGNGILYLNNHSNQLFIQGLSKMEVEEQKLDIAAEEGVGV